MVFSPDYVQNLTFLLPVDSGLWESSCNRSHHWGSRMNCSAWNRSATDPLLGTLSHFDQVAKAWLTPEGIWQPSYPTSVPARLFERLFREESRGPMMMTTQEGSYGQVRLTSTCSLATHFRIQI